MGAERLYPKSEKNIFENQRRENGQYKYESNKAVNDKRWSQYTHPHPKKVAPDDIVFQKYNILIPKGSLEYHRDISKKTWPEILNEYGEPYVNNRNNALWNTLNKADINVSGYYFQNNYVKRVPAAITQKLLIKK
jgi:hypothetical protein